MRPFDFAHADDARTAPRMLIGDTPGAQVLNAASQYLAGGTTLIDLMKLDVMRPQRVVDINGLQQQGLGDIEADANGLRLGALVRMAQVADHVEVRRNYPVVAQSLQLAASEQIRNMASLAGNVLQRTRCSYFRDTSYQNCNKRIPGSGCAALEGVNRMHAVLGTSGQCIATYPGDFGQALIALDAKVSVAGARGSRELPFAELHRPPGDRPHIEHTLQPGELITGFHVPALPFARRSMFLKIRDRESYEFAVASAAVALDLEGDIVREARIALGGLATVPWRARDAEVRLKGQRLDDEVLKAAATAAFDQALPRRHNAFKVALGQRTMIRALRQAAALEV